MAPPDFAGTKPAPDGPRGSWLTGNMTAYNADPLAFVAGAVREFGDFVPLRLGPVRGVLLSDPKVVEAVLVEHHKSFRKSRGVRRLRSLLGNGLLLSDGADWLRHRRMMQPAFHRTAVDRHSEVMVKRISAALGRWESSDLLDVVPETHRLALEIATRTLFGADISEAEAREIGHALDVATVQLQTRVSSLKMFIPDWVPSPGNRRMNAAIERVDRLVLRIIDQRRRSEQGNDDLLGMLLAEEGRSEGRLTDRELRDEVVTLLVAGHETTALTLAWAMYEIARHPAVGVALRDEAISVLGAERTPTPADIPSLPVTASIVRETLRLYPAGYVTAREAIADVTVAGHTIKRGTLVLISQWEQHREPTVFADPATFRPERWLGSLSKELERGDYFPFGLGPRMCIGASFANLELMLAVPMIGRRFGLEPASPVEPKPIPKITLNPDQPIRLRLVPAQAARTLPAVPEQTSLGSGFGLPRVSDLEGRL
jgi:cytochrome P450